MRPFAYRRPADARAAVEAALDAPRAMYLGGGTNLVDLMRLGVAEPDLLVDVAGLPYDTIRETGDGGLEIGGAVRNSDLAAHPAVRRDRPMLAQALLSAASGQIRNAATVAGNLLQRTRCAYFQDVSKPCNKRIPGSGCPAIEGDHYNLAILGHSAHCVATHPSDMAVALTAFGAAVHVEGPGGRREIGMPGLHRLPGDRPEVDTVLDPGDLITGLTVRPLPFAARSRYRKVRERASFAFALVSVAAALDVEDGTVRDCRVALGGVAHAPWRAERLEEALRGRPATEGSYAEAADAELDLAEPLRDNAYKIPLARKVIVRTLAELGG
ncbi:FAD binding domain-containing protein [Bailinhaonella thermotolerans]|uniref:Xanthine dehydrogenase family protein subunit M n=1 Tax=Bailinhaonella thermotolerans TaxID=1070861 RepID=A0A3A4A874_9ACTN|nr:xanthine dehydrogenase family protein subunit M [Bailinhaonella thermotolerans]RJL24169.1 xanthine dehydrogenase family protein subunit M [Bailinhaonella thermotolerans]